MDVRVLLEPAPNATSEASAGQTFFYVASHATKNGGPPEAFHHSPFLPAGGGATLRVNLDGSWNILSSCQDSGSQCGAKGNTVAQGSGLPVKAGRWMDVSLSLTPGATGLRLVASVGGTSLVDKTLACRECHFAGPVGLGTGFHGASFDNFTLTPTK